jgi:Alpha amylase, catalytic domain
MAGGTISAKKFSLRAHPVLYEINTWVWLEQLSERLGKTIKLGDVPDAEWDSLARTGFDAVWLMGIWRRSAESRRLALADPGNPPVYDRTLPGWKPDDVVGSPYAVAGYVPDVRIGTWDDVDKARQGLHARGMALFVDFVGNHTAVDHPWTRSNPEFYVQGTEDDFEKDRGGFYGVETAGGARFIALGKDPYFPPWRDTAQLNHFEPGLRAAEIAGLRTIASHCDGVRCDMAMLQLNDIFGRLWGYLLRGLKAPATEFWGEAHRAVPELTLLAEAYWGTEGRLLDLGFSYAYDKGMYDAVRDMRISDVRNQLNHSIEAQGRFAHFLENHDEARCVTVFGKQRLPSAAALMGTLPGMRLYHQGELEGYAIHLPITLRTAAPQPADPDIEALFAKILQVTKEGAFHEGTWALLPVTQERDETYANLIAYEWRLGSSWRVIIINLAGEASQGWVHFGDRALNANEYIFHDEWDDAKYWRGSEGLRSEGLFVRKDAFQAHIFDVTPA